MSVTRGKVSEEHVKKMNDEGYGLELGCDSSSLWNVKTTECYCNEAKCNGAAGVRSDGSVGLKTLLITISMAAFFLTKP